jgi:hypothetical protein
MNIRWEPWIEGFRKVGLHINKGQKPHQQESKIFFKSIIGKVSYEIRYEYGGKKSLPSYSW